MKEYIKIGLLTKLLPVAHFRSSSPESSLQALPANHASSDGPAQLTVACIPYLTRLGLSFPLPVPFLTSCYLPLPRTWPCFSARALLAALEAAHHRHPRRHHHHHPHPHRRNRPHFHPPRQYPQHPRHHPHQKSLRLPL